MNPNIKHVFVEEFKSKVSEFFGVPNDIEHRFLVASQLNTLLRKYKVRGIICEDAHVTCVEGVDRSEMKITLLKRDKEVNNIDEIFV